MKVLVIPDVHLKPWMFGEAARLMREGRAQRSVCLMDLPDDWDKTFDLDSYTAVFDAAAAFAKEFPDTLWCYGNHDVCYLWNRRESGYSPLAAGIVAEKLGELRESLEDPDQLAFIHRIDGCLFLHGGLSASFVEEHVPEEERGDADAVIRRINRLGSEALWRDDSPVWLRPQFGKPLLYEPRRFLQVVGHTPVPFIQKREGVLSCDVFSTDRAGGPIGLGANRFPVVDTREMSWEEIPVLPPGSHL